MPSVLLVQTNFTRCTQTENVRVARPRWHTLSGRRSMSGEPIRKAIAILVIMQTKKELTDNVKNLCKAFARCMQELLPHRYRMINQHQVIRFVKDKLATLTRFQRKLRLQGNVRDSVNAFWGKSETNHPAHVPCYTKENLQFYYK